MTAFRLISLVRHPEATFNVQGRVQGQSLSSVITPRGRRQAGKFWESFLRSAPEPDTVFCSDPPRASAMLEGMPFRAPIVLSPMLREIGRGAFEGKEYSDPEWQEFCRKMEAGGDASEDYPGVESHAHALERGMGFLRGAALHSSGKHVLLVSHGELNRLIVASLLGRSVRDLLSGKIPPIGQPNCCVNRIAWDGERLLLIDYGIVPEGVQGA